jgi:N-acetylmuramic acid 6-phosphate (MurNAc-6-P) etherase
MESCVTRKKEMEGYIDTGSSPVASGDGLLMKGTDQFQFGELDTEGFHPLTERLSQVVQRNHLTTSNLSPSNCDLQGISDGLRLLRQVDCAALDSLLQSTGFFDSLLQLTEQVRQTLYRKGRVFLTGCGASGRVALSLGTMARSGVFGSYLQEPGRVQDFIAGGDVAYVRSIENFEDNASYGKRMLMELGFTFQGAGGGGGGTHGDDFLIAFSAGGAAPFVVGALKAATDQPLTDAPPLTTDNSQKEDCTNYPAAFVYCNPRSQLVAASERSRWVMEKDDILKVESCIGPMAVSGSTRMQAATAQLLVGALALFFGSVTLSDTGTNLSSLTLNALREVVTSLRSAIASVDYAAMAPFTATESRLYASSAQGRSANEVGLFTYSISPNIAGTVLTDLTERSPTFSLPPLEPCPQEHSSTTSTTDNLLAHSPCQVYPSLLRTSQLLEGSGEDLLSTVEGAWRTILGRPLRCLHWEDLPEVHRRTATGAALKYDFSASRTYRHPNQGPNFSLSLLSPASEDGSVFQISFQTPQVRSDPKSQSSSPGARSDWLPFSITIALPRVGLDSKPWVAKLDESRKTPEVATGDPPRTKLCNHLTRVNVFCEQLLIKCLMNAHSTCVMAKVGRVTGNLMVYVRPSNGKLVDRCARYVQRVLAMTETGLQVKYDDALRAVSAVSAPGADPQPCVVLAACEWLKRSKQGSQSDS